ncbi:hypothetical protein AB0J63_42295 [Streptosporangium canum]|uniref:hypothetical protein n=1 Tax=Streptosporangium canum TaxID=324952 RepID=UPI00343EAA34
MAVNLSRAAGPVRRLRVVASRQAWRVIDDLRVEKMALFRSRELPHRGTRVSGTWYEALGTNGDVVYRRSLGDPFERSMEIFQGHRVVREPLPEQDVTMELLVPETSVTSVRLVVDGEEIPYGEADQQRAGGYRLAPAGKGGKDGHGNH